MAHAKEQGCLVRASHVSFLALLWQLQLTVETSDPEFRLIWMVPACVCCGLGMFLFGYSLQIGASAYVCAFLQGLMMVGVLIGIFSTLSYGLDSFRSQSNEIFVMNMLFKVQLLNLITRKEESH